MMNLHEFGNKMGRRLTALLSVSAVALLQPSLHGGVFDDAKVYFRGPVDANGDNVLDPGEYRDSFHYGTADATWSAVAKGACRLETDRVVYSYRNVTTDETVLALPQPMDVVDGNDVLQTGVVVLPTPFTPHLADGFSVIVRMRWDGPLRWCLDDANNTMTNMPYCYFFRATGGGMPVTLGINTPNKPPCNPSDSFSPLVTLFGNLKTFNGLACIKTNEWIDAAFVVATDGNVTGYLHYPGAAEIVSQTIKPTAGAESEGDVSFQIGGLTAGETVSNTHTRYGQRNPYMCFRGAYQRVAVWQRSLTADEVREAFAAPGVDIATFGRADGTADEFGGTAGGAVDVRSPAASWQGFPSSFAATDAPTAVSFRLSAADVPVGFLSTDALLRMKATPGSASGVWNVAVNGTALRPVLLKAGGWAVVTVPCGTLVSGANQLTLKYAGSGVASLDCLLLGGNWQLGFQDDSYGEFSGTIGASQKTSYRVGNGRLSNVQKMILIATGDNGRMGFHVNLPDDLVEGYRYVCTVRAKKINSSLTTPVSLYLNGASEPLCTFADVSSAAYSDYRYEIPMGALQRGDNAFVFKMTGSETESSTARYIGFDCFRFESIRVHGFMMLIR